MVVFIGGVVLCLVVVICIFFFEWEMKGDFELVKVFGNGVD